ncbi:MAG: response regulator [Deltaproteobacteria bacterium]|nr:response regulator [Deltaproteobacteria bacterium]
MEKLLLVGEELAADNEVRTFIERAGYEVVTGHDRTSGLEQLASAHPAVVIIDHDLGEQDGVELLVEIRRIDPSCEAVLVTPGGEIEAAIEVLRAGALDYLRRPIDTELLGIALGRARERGGQRAIDESKSILVLEDHEPTLKRLIKVLRKEGFEVDGAPDGKAGMLLFEQKRFDLILADMRMPHKDGIEVLRETKGAGADVEVIVVTGYGDEDVVVTALREGAINFLRKPIEIEQMLLAIQKALDFQTMRRSLAYRNRHIEIMQELVVRLTHKLELVVETPWKMSTEAREFLRQLVDVLPIGIVVVGSDRKIIYANQVVVGALRESPIKLSTEWLEQMGITKVSQDELEQAFDRTATASTGAVETLMVSKWAFLVMTPLKLIRPDGTERFVVLAIRGERRGNGKKES